MKEFIKMFLTDDDGKEFTKSEIIKTAIGVIAVLGVLLISSIF